MVFGVNFTHARISCYCNALSSKTKGKQLKKGKEYEFHHGNGFCNCGLDIDIWVVGGAGSGVTIDVEVLAAVGHEGGPHRRRCELGMNGGCRIWCATVKEWTWVHCTTKWIQPHPAIAFTLIA